ncbi:MAG: hypothetical protein H0T46_25305 [Deltaproteobacteria bacterium]|nr:hypothetical protein [Deltaproteobacteria bacterium]
MSRVWSVALVALSILTACPQPAPAPVPLVPTPSTPVAVADAAPDGPLDLDLPRLAARATKLYQDVAVAFAEAGEDCAAAASKLAALQTAYADVVTANAKVLHEGRARELSGALEPHADALDTAAKAIVGSKTMSKCSPDRAFTDAFDNLVGAPP